MSRKRTRSDETLTARFHLFHQLLYEKHISPSTDFASARKFLLADARFVSLKSESERETAFNEWKLEAKLMIPAIQQQLRLDNLSAARLWLHRWLGFSSHSNYSDVTAHLKFSPCAEWDKLSESDRVELFECERRRKAKEIAAAIERRKRDFLALLKRFIPSMDQIPVDLEQQISADPEYLALNERERKEVFARLSVEFDREFESRDRSQYRDEEVEVREKFAELLEEIAWKGKIHPNTKWKTIEIELEGNNQTKTPANQNSLENSTVDADAGAEAEEGELSLLPFRVDDRYFLIKQFARSQAKLAKSRRWNTTNFDGFLSDAFEEFTEFLSSIAEKSIVTRVRSLIEKSKLVPISYSSPLSLLSAFQNRIPIAERRDIEDFTLIIAIAQIFDEENQLLIKRREIQSNTKNNSS